MEREGCVASTQAAAFLQTAVAPQPHKQPHIGPQPQRSSALTLVGGEVFSASSSSLLGEGLLLCKLRPIDLCLKALLNPSPN